MKKLLFIFTLISIFAFKTFAQAADSIQVDKAPGSTLTLTWTFPTTEEGTIDGFVVETSPVLSGPYTQLSTVLKTARTATALVGTVPLFYQIFSYKTGVSPAPRIESDRSNPVAVRIVLTAPLGAGGR